jgi:ubiquinone biosynthesis protein
MPGLLTPRKAVKHLQRYRQVVGVMTRYGFGEFFSQIRLWEFVNIEKRLLKTKREFEHIPTAQRLRLALEELGPTFVKLGQMLSTRPDIVPPDLIRELEKLQNRVAPVDTAIIKQTIEAELNRPLSELFDRFDEEPLAAASLAQVHRAEVKGREVVIKVQRPHVREIIDVDLDILNTLAGLMERYLKGLYVLNPAGLVKEFSANLLKELDFLNEIRNIRLMAKNFQDVSWVHIPEVYDNSYCSPKIITMEYIDGISIADIPKLKENGYDLAVLAAHGADIAFRSALEFGFFHADPHPGNIVIQPGNTVCMLDYGMMGRISSRHRNRIGQVLYYIAENDERRTARALLGLIESNEVIDAESLEVDISDIIHEFGQASLRNINLGNIFFRLLKLLARHKARFPTQLIWLFKAIATLEETAQKLDPQFELVKAMQPYAKRLVFKNMNPFKQSREVYLTLSDALNLLRDLPYDVSVVLDQLKKGKVKIEFEHVGLDPLRKTLHKISHHISLTILLAALLLSASLIVLAKTPPLIGEFPLVSIILFGVALLVAVLLIITMILE